MGVKSKGKLSYSARTGAIAGAQLPLIVALGMRNNPIGWLTGIGHEKLNLLHRVTARTLLVLVWVHGAARIQHGLKGESDIHESQIRWAFTAAVALSIVCLVFIRPVRERAYEVFIVSHFLLVFFFILGAYYHASFYHFEQYVWPAFLLWGLDRFLRIARLVLFNHGYLIPEKSATCNATVERVADGFVRLRFHRPAHLHWAPGQFAFITMPTVSKFAFESHPFTIANADVPAVEDRSTSGEKRDSVDSSSSNALDGHRELVFFIKKQEGFTHHLDELAKVGGQLTVLFDGPYGHPPRLAYYDTVVFIACGSGVSFTNSLFVDLVHRARADPTMCRSVIFVWAIRQTDHVSLIYSDLLRVLESLPPTLHISIRIHVSKSATSESTPSSPESPSSPVSPIDEKKTAAYIDLAAYEQISWYTGRPDVQSVIQEAIDGAQGSVAVNVCGPRSIAQDVKRVLRGHGPASVMRGGPSVSLFIDSFSF